MNFRNKPVIACIHLLPTLGSHQYDGDVERIYDTALAEARLFIDHGVDALIVENFRDGPFYPDRVSTQTTATVACVLREVVRMSNVPVGVAVLRNDAEAAICIAAAANAHFIRVNVHVGAVLAAQGVLQGRSHETLRLRAILRSDIAILADARVKHSTPWTHSNLADEVRDLAPHADAVVISGALTGLETESIDLEVARRSTSKPIVVGSGVTPENLDRVFDIADGFIVGSYFKVDGVPFNSVDAVRVGNFMSAVKTRRRNASRPGEIL